MTLKRNTVYCRIVSLLILLMMVRYRGIFVLFTDPGSGPYSITVVGFFYLLNIASMIGLFIPRKWGFVFSYFAIPLSTFVFATSYLSFITDWFPRHVMLYLIPFVNAILLISIIMLHARHKHL